MVRHIYESKIRACLAPKKIKVTLIFNVKVPSAQSVGKKVVFAWNEGSANLTVMQGLDVVKQSWRKQCCIKGSRVTTELITVTATWLSQDTINCW